MAAGSSARRSCSQPRATRWRRRSCRWSINRLPFPRGSAQRPRTGASHMQQATAVPADERPMWRRIVDFPLVAMLIALLVAAAGITGEGDATDLVPALILSAIFPAISEEMIFRGILFRWIEEFGGSWAALLLTSAFFGAVHLANPNATPLAAIGIAFEAGVMLGGAYMLTRSLWLAMGLHAAWNFAQGEIYDIPVSGTPVHGLVTARLSGPPLLTGNGFGLEA